LDPAQVDRFCRHQKFSGWFDTSAKNDINIDEAIQFLVGKVIWRNLNYIRF
jgi:Ras-related protein Rab-32